MPCPGEPATVLTPENRFVLLYEAFDVARCYRVDAEAEYRIWAAAAPAARSFFDVYWNGGDTLAYAKSPCVREDVENRFFLHVVPVAPASLSLWRRRWGFDNLDFRFVHAGGTLFDGKCLVTAELPAYEIAAIRTGQFKRDSKRIGKWRESWSATIHARRTP